MAVILYNYLTRKKELFKPIKARQVGLYTCGPTVYGEIHIGNARTFVVFDILKRYLEYLNYKVKYISNITDVGHLTDAGEDKIMKGAAETNLPVKDFVEKNIENYFSDLDSLNIKGPDISPRASEHIEDIIAQVKILFEKGFAYELEGSVYFDIAKFKDYGKLSRQPLEELKKQRTEPGTENKKNPGDFALWIAAPADYPLVWQSPWGIGFPGWHIECSTMSSKYLGLPFDIHGGGIDLLFPHHENEIAQAEAASGKKFVNFWIESEHLLVNRKKMAKSLGNFYTLEDIEKKGFNPLSFRYLVLNTHYRSKLNFNWEILQNAKNAYERLKNVINELRDGKNPPAGGNPKYLEEFEKAINDDLNMPTALAVLWKLLRDKKAEGKIKAIKKMDKVFGLDLLKKEKLAIPKEVKKLVNERKQARLEKSWQKADELRQKAESLGWLIKDTSQGPTLRKRT